MYRARQQAEREAASVFKLSAESRRGYMRPVPVLRFELNSDTATAAGMLAFRRLLKLLNHVIGYVSEPGSTVTEERDEWSMSLVVMEPDRAPAGTVWDCALLLHSLTAPDHRQYTGRFFVLCAEPLADAVRWCDGHTAPGEVLARLLLYSRAVEAGDLGEVVTEQWRGLEERLWDAHSERHSQMVPEVVVEKEAARMQDKEESAEEDARVQVGGVAKEGAEAGRCVGGGGEKKVAVQAHGTQKEEEKRDSKEEHDQGGVGEVDRAQAVPGAGVWAWGWSAAGEGLADEEDDMCLLGLMEDEVEGVAEEEEKVQEAQEQVVAKQERATDKEEQVAAKDEKSKGMEEQAGTAPTKRRGCWWRGLAAAVLTCGLTVAVARRGGRRGKGAGL